MPSDYAPLEVVERHHTEHKAAVAELSGRVTDLEVEHGRMSERFLHLDKTLVDLTKAIENVKPPKPWQLFIASLPLILAAIGVIWQASKYPTRDEYYQITQRLMQVEVDSRINRQLIEIEKSKRGGP